jgi:hypothetical protein
MEKKLSEAAIKSGSRQAADSSEEDEDDGEGEGAAAAAAAASS